MKFKNLCDHREYGRFWLPALALLALIIIPTINQAANAESLRVAMSGQYMPLHGEQDGEKVGFEVDLAQSLGNHLGNEVVFLSRSELGMGTLQAVAEGKADIGLSAITPTEERRKIVDFSKPIAAVPYLVVHDGSANPCEKEILAAQGPAYEAAKKALGNLAKSVKDDMAALQMIQKGTARCAVVEEPSIANYRKEASTLKVLEKPVGESPIAIAVPKGKKREIDALLDALRRDLYEYQAKWGVSPNFDTAEALILPYAGWPTEIKAPWVPAPDFGMKYYRQLREAYEANRLQVEVQKLTKGADQATTTAIVDSLVKLARDNPGVLDPTRIDLDILSKTSLDGKKHLVRILHAYLLSPKEKQSWIVLSGITTSISKANASPYIELSQLRESLCNRELNFENLNNSTFPELLMTVFKQRQMKAVQQFIIDFYNEECGGRGEGLSENEARQEYISWYEDPITYALAKNKDWRFTEEILRKLLQDIVMGEGHEHDSAILMSAETIAMFNPELTERLEPMIVEAKAHIFGGDSDRIRSEYKSRAAEGAARASAEDAHGYALSKSLEYKTKFLSPKIYDRRNSTQLAELPAKIRDYLEKNLPPDPPGTGNAVPELANFNKNYRYRLDVWDQYSKKVILFAIYDYNPWNDLHGESGEYRDGFFYDPISKTVGKIDLKSENMIKFCEVTPPDYPNWNMDGVLDLNKDGNPEAFFQCVDNRGGGGYSYQEWKDGKFIARKLPRSADH